MRIRTQLILTMLLFGIVLAAISASAIITHRQIENASEQEKIASSIAQGASELSYLANDYVIYRENQQLERWQTRFVSFSADVARLQTDRMEHQALVRNIQANTQRLKDVFDSVVSEVGSLSRNQVGTIDTASFRVSWSRIAVQSQGLVSDASRLSQLLDNQVEQLQQTNSIVVIALIGVFGAYFLVNYLMVQRRTLKSMATLQAGTSVIGSGNLDFKIEEKANDEIGDLSRAFNRMTADLKNVTTSKADLEIEIAARQEAEEELLAANKNLQVKTLELVAEINERKKAEEQLRTTLESIGDGFFACDADWRFVYVNTAAESILDIRRKEVLGKSHWEVFPLMLGTDLEREYRRAAAGGARDFENFYEPWGRWFHHRCFPREGGGMSVYFQDITERKQAEQKLVEQAATLANVSDAIIGYDTDYRVTYWNQAAEEIYGYSLAEAMGKVGNVLLNATYDGITREELVGRITRDGHLETESGRSAKDGRTLYVETHVIALRDENSNITGYVAVDRDITERKKTEVEVAHLASFPELNPNPILELDTAGNVTYLNPSAKKILPDIATQGSKHPFLAGWDARLSTIRSQETRLISRDISMGDSWYEQTATYVPLTNSYRIYGRDITERKRAEEALRETRDYLDNLFNYANAPIIVWDPELRVTRFNHAFQRLTGRPATEIIGKSLDILFPEETRARSMEHIRRVHVGRRMEVEEIPVQHRDGSVRTVLWNSAILYAPDGKTAIATIAQGQDITERKLAEEELRQRTVELEATNKELEAFSYSVSHDLRAPLRSMEGFSSALIEDYAEKLDEQGKLYLRYVQESSNLMGQLIDDLLKLSRVTRGDMSHERVDLSAIAQKILADLEKTGPDRKVSLLIAPDIIVYGDRNLLRLALENLLGNACKFSSKAAEPRIEMGTIEHEGECACFIRDNGVGFDMAYADKLFKPFQRLHRASEFSGTGIGLATVQRIIRRHGGKVWAESKVGEGATFYFTLS